MSARPAWPGLTYGAVERLLADLQGTTAGAVRTRFRKLRLRPFPDEIRAGTGVRVAYDLPRVLALAAVFDLNRLYVPQGHAVAMVEAGWPEWCRAAIAAACRLGVAGAPFGMPSTASPWLRIVADAFGVDGDGSELGIHYAGGLEPAPDHATPPWIAVDVRRIVGAIAAAAGPGARVEVGGAFGSLERGFGWTDPPTPHRSSVAEMSRGRGFLDEGPFFERARLLLSASDDEVGVERPRLARARQQWLFSYIERPAPIDRWKAEVGDDEARPRLKHLLNAWAVQRGLEVEDRYPELLGSVGADDLKATALRYIHEATAATAGVTNGG